MISCSRGRELMEEHVSEKIEWIVSLRAAAAIAVVLLFPSLRPVYSII